MGRGSEDVAGAGALPDGALQGEDSKRSMESGIRWAVCVCCVLCVWEGGGRGGKEGGGRFRAAAGRGLGGRQACLSGALWVQAV